MLDWNATVRWAVVGVSVVESAPESVESLVENVLDGERVLGELKIALEQFSFAGALGVGRFKSAPFAGVFPDVLDELADAGVAVLFADALLAVFVGLAFIVQTVLEDQG